MRNLLLVLLLMSCQPNSIGHKIEKCKSFTDFDAVQSCIYTEMARQCRNLYWRDSCEAVKRREECYNRFIKKIIEREQKRFNNIGSGHYHRPDHEGLHENAIDFFFEYSLELI